MRLTVPKMIERKRGGSIINIASIAGLQPQPGGLLYSFTKAGLIMMTRSWAREFGPHGIRVNAIAPGLIQTDFSEYFWKNEQYRAQRRSRRSRSPASANPTRSATPRCTWRRTNRRSSPARCSSSTAARQRNGRGASCHHFKARSPSSPGPAGGSVVPSPWAWRRPDATSSSPRRVPNRRRNCPAPSSPSPPRWKPWAPRPSRCRSTFGRPNRSRAWRPRRWSGSGGSTFWSTTRAPCTGPAFSTRRRSGSTSSWMSTPGRRSSAAGPSCPP